MKSIVVIQGHPDPKGGHFGHALAEAYAAAAREAGHWIETIDVARLEFPLLRTKEDFERGLPPESIRSAQALVGRTDLLVIFYPLWLGGMPALLKGFLEQLFRPGFVSGGTRPGASRVRTLEGKRARIVVTMGMPAVFYRWYFGAHSLKSLERSILRFCGIGPIEESLIGGVEAEDGRERERWLARMREFGRKAA
jgi:putative NADPH-quinone reductase